MHTHTHTHMHTHTHNRMNVSECTIEEQRLRGVCKERYRRYELTKLVVGAKGYWVVSRAYSTTPRLQMSTATPKGCFSTISGA
jgi:hypothetical protein